MTDQLLNSIKRHVSDMIGRVGQTRVATVSSVNPTTYSVRVLYQPEDILSGWLPIAANMIGGGWGVVTPPQPGDQVIILAQEGDSEHGIMVGSLFSKQQLPPKTYTDQYNQGATTPVQSGEVGLVHESGTFLRLLGGRVLIHGDVFIDGNVRVTGNVVSDANMHADGHIDANDYIHAKTHFDTDGFILATGNINSQADVSDVHGTLDLHRRRYNVHAHPQNGFPIPQDPE